VRHVLPSKGEAIRMHVACTKAIGSQSGHESLSALCPARHRDAVNNVIPEPAMVCAGAVSRVARSARPLKQPNPENCHPADSDPATESVRYEYWSIAQGGAGRQDQERPDVTKTDACGIT
jgi:hypothetical protein